MQIHNEWNIDRQAELYRVESFTHKKGYFEQGLALQQTFLY